MTASALSPSSSPRLPSPPPIAEDQLGPKSPIAATEEQQKLFSSLDHGASRRIRPGTKAEDMAEGPPLIDLSEIDSAFQLTEHLKALHNSLTHPAGSNTITAIDREMALKLAQPPENVDKALWLYELCRFLTQKVNSIIIALFSDNPPCSSITCPEMRASEWQYLCAVHDPPKSCCAIDYCCHTLDWAANSLTSPKNFPSRLAMGSDMSTQDKQMRNLTNIFRRVYRIFAHAWFQHREMFWKVEGRTGLYILFKTVCDEYGLIPEDSYTIPPEAEGVEPSTEATPTTMPFLLLRRQDPSGPGALDSENSTVIEGDHSLSTGGTTKRHRHSPSVGATMVSTVVEEAEEEDEQEDPIKEEPGTPASHLESTTETPAEPAEDVDHSDKPKIGEEAESILESTPAVAEESQAPEEGEKQASGEDPQPEPHKDGSEPEATTEEQGATSEDAAPEEQGKEVPQSEAEQRSSQEEPEKREKEEASADPDKSTKSE